MRSTLLSFVITLSFVAGAADVPGVIHYQGLLKDSGARYDGAATFSFSFYDALTGGSSLWSSGDLALNVASGLYSVELGAAPMLAVPANLFADNAGVYLEVTFNSQMLSPRQRVVAVPYALVAQ